MSHQPTEARRLGRRRLGRHAFEEHMPDRVHAIAAETHGNNQLSGVVPVLAQLLSQDGNVKAVYLCRDSVYHIYKANGEGDHFCGYRNMQMLLSSCDGTTRTHDIPEKKHNYSIIDLQTLIEEAWASGINSAGRVETGGILDTRKHIGTAEAQALFEYLGLAGPAKAFSNMHASKTAYVDLLDYIEGYFSSTSFVEMATGKEGKIHRTALAPIYLQRPRHSLTIVGIERRHDGSRSLLVFDPGYDPPQDLQKALAGNTEVKHPKSVLKAYRRNERYLKRYRAFETLQLSPPHSE